MTGVARNPWLVAGGMLSIAAALTHLAVIIGGPDWYRFMGAGEQMARMAEAGRVLPALITLVIAGALAVMGGYALSGAGVIPQLPLRKVVVVAITAVYLARGAFLFAPALMGRPDLSSGFLIWSSAIVLIYGLVHAIGVWRGWAQL